MKTKSLKYYSGLAACSLFGLAATSSLQSAEVTALAESFETDGLDNRYFAIGGGDNGETDFFARRAEFSAGTDASGGTIDGEFFWGASDVDNINNDLPSDDFPDLGARDGVLVFNDIDVSGLSDLKLEMAVAQGQGTFEPDNHFRIQIRFDDTADNVTFGNKDWITIGGFRSVSTNVPARYFAGPLRLTTEDDPRLTSSFQEWAWDIWGFGDTIDIRIIMNSNWRDEDYYVDNIRLKGDDSLIQVDATMTSTELTEPADSESVDVTFTASEAAPAGGLTFDVIADEWLPDTLPMPETVTIPEGDTSFTVTLDHIADGRFTGTKLVEARFDSDAISRESLIFSVTNTTDKPKVLMMEVLNVFPGAIESDLQGDANGDGARTYPGDLFVELVNFEDFPVELTGWTIEDDLGPRYQFPDGFTLQPGRAVVIFGGGDPLGVFGGADVLTVGTSNGFAFNTTRAEIAGLFAPFGGEMEIIDLPFRSQILETTLQLPESDPAFGETSSIHRTSDEVDGTFDLHLSLDNAAGDTLFFSPGARPDGTPYFTPSTEATVMLSADTAAETDGPVQGSITLSNAAPAGGLTLGIGATGNGSQVELSETFVTLAEGETSASFSIAPIDDDFLDGDFDVSVIVTGPEGSDVLGGFDTMVITDNEVNNFNIEIAEFFIGLAGTGADPNLNGTVEEDVADQFIEVVNRSGFPVDISGWSIVVRVGGEFALRQEGHQFAGGTILADDGAAVAFGEIFNSEKGNLSFGGAYVDDASNDDGNGGLHADAGASAFVDLVNEFGFPVATLEIPSDLTDQGMSVTLDDSGNPALHLQVASGLGSTLTHSPGVQPDGTPYPGNGFAYSGAGSMTSGFVVTESDFGPLYIEGYPWAHLYEASDWWFSALVDGQYWYYSATADIWVWTNAEIFPWAYAPGTDTWIELL